MASETYIYICTIKVAHIFVWHQGHILFITFMNKCHLCMVIIRKNSVQSSGRINCINIHILNLCTRVEMWNVILLLTFIADFLDQQKSPYSQRVHVNICDLLSAIVSSQIKLYILIDIYYYPDKGKIPEADISD